MTLILKDVLEEEKIAAALYQPGFCPCCAGTTRPLEGCSWVTCSDGRYPENAVFCDFDFNHVVLISRASVEGEVLPGKFNKEFNMALIPNKGEIKELKSYQVLTAAPHSLAWVPSSKGKMVKNALIGGQTGDGELIFIGRFLTKSFHLDRQVLCPGKIQPSLKKCIIPGGNGSETDDKVFSSPDYEILIGVPDGIRPVPGKFAEIVPKHATHQIAKSDTKQSKSSKTATKADNPIERNITMV